MSAYTELLNNLTYLGLEQIKENLDTYIDLLTNGKKTVVDALNELTRLEIKLKEEKRANTNVKVANFPFIKTIKDFDFTFQPSRSS